MSARDEFLKIKPTARSFRHASGVDLYFIGEPGGVNLSDVFSDPDEAWADALSKLPSPTPQSEPLITEMCEHQGEWPHEPCECPIRPSHCKCGLLIAKPRSAHAEVQSAGKVADIRGEVGSIAEKFSLPGKATEAIYTMFCDQAVRWEAKLPPLESRIINQRSEIGSLTKRLAEVERERDEAKEKLSRLPADWFTDSSLETWFPLTAEQLSEAIRGREVAERALRNTLDERLTAIPWWDKEQKKALVDAEYARQMAAAREEIERQTKEAKND